MHVHRRWVWENWRIACKVSCLRNLFLAHYEWFPSSPSKPQHSRIPSICHFAITKTATLTASISLPWTKTTKSEGAQVMLAAQKGHHNPTFHIGNHIVASSLTEGVALASCHEDHNIKVTSKSRFMKLCNDVWSIHDESHMTEHSFRIGGATAFLQTWSREWRDGNQTRFLYIGGRVAILSTFTHPTRNLSTNNEPSLSRPLHTSPTNDLFTPRFRGGRSWRLMQAKALSWEPGRRVRPPRSPPRFPRIGKRLSIFIDSYYTLLCHSHLARMTREQLAR